MLNYYPNLTRFTALFSFLQSVYQYILFMLAKHIYFHPYSFQLTSHNISSNSMKKKHNRISLQVIIMQSLKTSKRRRPVTRCSRSFTLNLVKHSREHQRVLIRTVKLMRDRCTFLWLVMEPQPRQPHYYSLGYTTIQM